MKVSDTPQLSAGTHCPSERSASQHPSGFQQVFQNMFDQAKTENPVPSAIMHSACPSPLTVNAIEPLPTSSGVQAIERFIDSLEAYQKRLEDPQNNLRDLEPDLERIEREHGNLSHWADKTYGDNPLKSILNEGLVTATLEINRFRSGEYC